VTRFLRDFPEKPERYRVGALPVLPFENGGFDLVLVSYLLFAYEEHFSYDFHREALLELMRVTQRKGEARIYPTVTFEAEPSRYVAQLRNDAACRGFRFEIVKTDFEFLVGSNCFLRVTHSR
jgi:ubiquinone/menaquinone biosynthesis C-methylase UbiE